MMNGQMGDWHWGFGFGHWSLGFLFWAAVILVVVVMVKYFSKK
jgi:hypothetical protein